MLHTSASVSFPRRLYTPSNNSLCRLKCVCVCLCVCVCARARAHNDTVDCSDYTAVIYHLENQMLRQVPHLSTFLPCTRFNKIFSFKSHCKTISVLQLLNMNLILNQLADFHMTRAFGQMWPSLKVRQPLSRAL